MTALGRLAQWGGNVVRKRFPGWDKDAVRKRLVEWGKDAAIVLLLVTAALLIRESGYFSVFRQSTAGTVGQSALAGQSEEESAAAMPIRPLKLHVSAPRGARIGLAWDAGGVSELFDGFAASLAEALGSAGAAETITETQWREHLLGESVCFDYSCAVPLSLLSSRLGVSLRDTEDFSASLLCLSCDGDTVWLCFRSEPDGGFYRCASAAGAAAVRARLDACEGSAASFAFEDERLSALEPYTLMLDELPEISSAISSPAPEGVDLEALMRYLGMNSNIIRPYTEADGTRVFVDSGKRLGIEPDGTVSFKGAAPDIGGNGAQANSPLDAVSLAERMLAPAGEAELGFAGAEPGQDGTLSCRFRYLVNGIPVELAGSTYAAEIILSGGVVTYLELHPRTYALTGKSETVLPMEPTAMMATSSGARRVELVYLDSGAALSCEWIREQ